jgi:trimethylamine--corrinoid protein Co-methyltransferase
MELPMNIPGVQIDRLTTDQCTTIHNASLEVLERTGVQLHFQEAVEMLRKAGARVSEGNRVRVPASLVEKALNTAPKQVQIFDRQGEPAMLLGGRNNYYGSGSDCLYIVDHRTNQRRRAVLQDVVEGARVGDALANVDFVMSMFLPSDVPPQISDVLQMEIMLNNTSKPIVFVTNEFQGCVDAVAMAEAVSGGAEALSARPFITCYINVTSGLVHNEEALQKLLFLSGKGLPAMYLPLVTAGMTGPATLPGSMAVLNAGALLGVVLSQLKREGAPVIVPGCGLTIIDMRTMVNPYCSPDGKGMTHAMGRYYGLPNFALGGGTESKLVDGQAAAEAALTLMSETLNGGNLIHDLGYLESGLSGSLAQLAICDEIVGWLRHYMAPVEVNEETLMLDLIDEKGPEGSFITHEHTLNHFREHWYPRLFERGNYSMWEKSGGKGLAERASEQVEKILAGGVKNPLPKEVAQALKAIALKAARQTERTINNNFA